MASPFGAARTAERRPHAAATATERRDGIRDAAAIAPGCTRRARPPRMGVGRVEACTARRSPSTAAVSDRLADHEPPSRAGGTEPDMLDATVNDRSAESALRGASGLCRHPCSDDRRAVRAARNRGLRTAEHGGGQSRQMASGAHQLVFRALRAAAAAARLSLLPSAVRFPVQLLLRAAWGRSSRATPAVCCRARRWPKSIGTVRTLMSTCSGCSAQRSPRRSGKPSLSACITSSSIRSCC